MNKVLHLAVPGTHASGTPGSGTDARVDNRAFTATASVVADPVSGLALTPATAALSYHCQACEVWWGRAEGTACWSCGSPGALDGTPALGSQVAPGDPLLDDDRHRPQPPLIAAS